MTVTNAAMKMVTRTATMIMTHAIVPSMKIIILTHATMMITHTMVVTVIVVAMTVEMTGK